MPLFSVPAHFDGKHVQLDEDVQLKPQSKLIVTVLEPDDSERRDFLRLSQTSLATSYDDDEVEYTIDDIVK